MVNAVLDPVPLIVFAAGTVAVTLPKPLQPAANACVRRFKFDPVVRLKLKGGAPPAKKEFMAANIMVCTLVQQNRTSLCRQR